MTLTLETAPNTPAAVAPIAAPAHATEPLPSFAVQDIQADALQFIANLTQRGDVVQYRVKPWLVTFVNRPEHIKHVLQDQHRNYVKTGTPDFMMLKPMLGEGILTSDGDAWLKQRRMAQPAFHRERVEGFDQLIVRETEATLAEWDVHRQNGTAVDVVTDMTNLTLRIVAEALFGYRISTDFDEFGDAVGVLNECMGHYDPRNVDLYRRFPGALRTIKSLVKDIINQRVCPAHVQGTGRGDSRSDSRSEDFLDVMLATRDLRDLRDTAHAHAHDGMTDEQIADQVLTVIMAGHETTAKSLSWTLYLLSQHPHIEAQLHDEVDRVLGGRAATAADLPALPLAWRVLEESMRLYPPVWIVSRVAVEADEIGGKHIPAGSLISISPYAMHRHPEFWDAPEQFDPDRFLPERVAARPAFAYMPFAGGPRLCLGKHLANVETHLALVTFAQRFSARLAPMQPQQVIEPEALVTLRPKFGLQMMLEARTVNAAGRFA